MKDGMFKILEKLLRKEMYEIIEKYKNKIL